LHEEEEGLHDVFKRRRRNGHSWKRMLGTAHRRLSLKKEAGPELCMPAWELEVIDGRLQQPAAAPVSAYPAARCAAVIALQVTIPLASVDSLPAGFSLIGPAGSDEQLLEVAVQLTAAVRTQPDDAAE
jgi:hypothetical protein